MTSEEALEKAEDCEKHIARSRVLQHAGDIRAWERVRDLWLEKAVEFEQRKLR